MANDAGRAIGLLRSWRGLHSVPGRRSGTPALPVLHGRGPRLRDAGACRGRSMAPAPPGRWCAAMEWPRDDRSPLGRHGPGGHGPRNVQDLPKVSGGAGACCGRSMAPAPPGRRCAAMEWPRDDRARPAVTDPVGMAPATSGTSPKSPGRRDLPGSPRDAADGAAAGRGHGFASIPPPGEGTAPRGGQCVGVGRPAAADGGGTVPSRPSADGRGPHRGSGRRGSNWTR